MRPGIYETLIALGADPATLTDPDRPGTRKIHCPAPFHNDRNKSCSVNYHEENFDGRGEGWINCHACGLRGNSIDIIMTVRQCLGGEAYEWAAKNIPGYRNHHRKIEKPRYIPKPAYVPSFDKERHPEYLRKLAEWSRATGNPMRDDDDD